MQKISFKSLCKKKWYQYLKYAYLTAFVISFALVMNDSVNILRPQLNKADSYILCDNGQAYTLGQQGMVLSEEGTISPKDDRLAKKLCVNDETIGELALASVKNIPEKNLSNLELGKKIKEGSTYMYQNMYNLLAPVDQNYKIVEVYKKHSLITILSWLFLPTLLLGIIFELELRIFYFLMLGRFLPEKPRRYFFFRTRY